MYLLKVEQAAQSAQIPGLVGKKFTVGKVSAVGGNGLNKWLVLNPVSAKGAAAKGSVMMKIEGGRQLPALLGKTVSVGKSPVIGAGGAKWLALHPVSAVAKGAAAGAAGIAGAGAASTKSAVVLSINEGSGHIGTLTGKTFVVGKSQVVGHGANNMLILNPANAAAGKSSVVMSVNNAAGGLKGLAGKTFVVGKAPIMGNGVNNMLVLFPSKAVAAKSAAASVVAGAGMAGSKGTLAKTAIVGKAVGKTVVAGTAVAAKGTATAATGTLWTGTGLSLGLGLGLGAMGPAIALTALTAGGYYLYDQQKKKGLLPDAAIKSELEEAAS